MQRIRYIVLGSVVVASVAVAWLLPHGELLQTLASVPIFASLTAVAVGILRDQAKREHETDLANIQQRFALAAGSHMASTAFDKHVAFCEEYIAEVLAALRTLFREGPCKEALAHSDQLHVIKQKYVVWVTRDLEARLDPFERALRRIGAVNTVVAQFPGGEAHHLRTNEMYKLFAEVLGTEHMGKEWEGEAITDAAAVSRVISHLRDALGVEELTLLRSRIVQQALATGQK
jgi:hypothetical protein